MDERKTEKRILMDQKKQEKHLCCMNMSAALKVSQEDGILTKWTNIYLENVI